MPSPEVALRAEIDVRARLAGLDAPDVDGGEFVVLGGWDRRRLSILEMASASAPDSGTLAALTAVRGLRLGDLLGDLERGDLVAGAVDGLAGGGGGGIDIVVGVGERG